MRFRVKLIIVALMAALVVGILYIGNLNNKRDEESKTVSDNTETVYLWYSDASFTEFFTYAAVAFHEKYSGIRVIPVLVDEGEYLESINFASVKGEVSTTFSSAFAAGWEAPITVPANTQTSARAIMPITFRFRIFFILKTSFPVFKVKYIPLFCTDYERNVNSIKGNIMMN